MSIRIEERDRLLADAAVTLAICADEETWEVALKCALDLAGLAVGLGHDADGADVFARYRTLLALRLEFER